MENDVKTARAETRRIRIVPSRLRLVADLIKGKSVDEARGILDNTNKKAAKIVRKTLDSAVANATFNNELDEHSLYVKDARVNEGTVYKRIKFDSRGHVGRNDHKTSNLVIVVESR